MKPFKLKTIKIEIELPSSYAETIDFLQRQTLSATPSDVVRKALRVYSHFITSVDSNKTLILRDNADNSETKLVIIA